MPLPQILKIKRYTKEPWVRLKGQNSVGRIDSINGKQAKVLFGSIFTLVKLDKLIAAEAPHEDKTIKVSTFVTKETRDAMYEKETPFQARNRSEGHARR